MNNLECAKCDGRGWYREWWEGETCDVACEFCSGKGQVSRERAKEI